MNNEQKNETKPLAVGTASVAWLTAPVAVGLAGRLRGRGHAAQLGCLQGLETKKTVDFKQKSLEKPLEKTNKTVFLLDLSTIWKRLESKLRMKKTMKHQGKRMQHQ